MFIDQLRRESSRPKLVTDVEKLLTTSQELLPPEVSDVNDRSKLDEIFDQRSLPDAIVGSQNFAGKLVNAKNKPGTDCLVLSQLVM